MVGGHDDGAVWEDKDGHTSAIWEFVIFYIVQNRTSKKKSLKIKSRMFKMQCDIEKLYESIRNQSYQYFVVRHQKVLFDGSTASEQEILAV